MLYNQTLELVEVTKLLERVPVDTMTFQNALGHDYVSAAVYISPVTTGTGAYVNFANFAGSQSTDNPDDSNAKNVAYKNIIAVNSTVDIIELCVWNFLQTSSRWHPTTTNINVTDPTGTEVYSGFSSATTGNVIGSFIPNKVGIYTITYGNTENISGQYKFYSVSNIEPSTPYTIATVIERILNAGLGNRNGYYTLDPDLYDMLNAIQAPEFCITRKNLYEALLEIGGYGQVQGLPVLKQDSNGNFTIISFDLLTGMTEWSPSSQVNIDGYIDYESEQDAESYCGGIEIYADNLVDNSTGGSVEQPLPSTVRTENSDLVINDNAAIIPTEFPIWNVQSVTQAFVANGQYVGDLTPYIFEKSQYDNKTSYTGTFPDAKQYAFYYVQGQPNLYGLTLKAETATDINAAVADFASVAIAKQKGKNYNKSNGIACFAYQVKYTPITTRRLRQYKANLSDGFPTANVLFYNPTTNVADAKNLGDHAAAQLQKIGNLVEIKTYKIYQIADLPQKGMRVGDNIITQVDYAFELLYIKATVYLTKYNRLSEYIGINSQKRFYEVSEKQSVQRAINYSYLATVQDTVPPGFATVPSVPSIGALQAFADSLTSPASGALAKIGAVVCSAFDQDGNPIQTPTIHEVVSNGFGKSSAFFFSFADNYSAGNQAVYCSYTKPGHASQKLQRAVPYGDELGRFYSLKMEYYTRAQMSLINTTYADQVTTESKPALLDRLPIIDTSIFSQLPTNLRTPFFTFTKVIDKNGGEQISVDTQIHFAAATSDLIVGNALGSRNAWTAGYTETQYYTPVFVCLPYKLAYNQETIPLADIRQYKVATPTVNAIGLPGLYYVRIQTVTNSTASAAQSWAVVSQEDGALLIGKNVSIPAGGTDIGCYIDFAIQPI